MIQYINYKGESLPFRVSTYAVGRATADTKKNIYEVFVSIDKNPERETAILFDNLDVLESLLFYALEAGHKFIDKKFDIKKENAPFILDVCAKDFIEGMSNMLFGNIENDEEEEPEEDKKK